MEQKVYHGSPNGNLKVLKPKKSTHLNNYVYATPNPAIALIFATENNGDLDFDLRVENSKIIFTERRKDAFNEYNKSGYLYTLDAKNFKALDILWEGEVVSSQEEEILQCEYIPNLFKKIEEYAEKGKIIIYRYPQRPAFIPEDDSDLAEKYIKYETMGHKGAIDSLLLMFPHLKEKVFASLENPSEFYYIDSKKTSFDSIIVSDNKFDALLRNDSPIWKRDNGWINYKIEDSKFVFEKGGFNFNDTFYLYKVKGNSKRLSAHTFRLNDVKIISIEELDLKNYIPDSVTKKIR